MMILSYFMTLLKEICYGMEIDHIYFAEIKWDNSAILSVIMAAGSMTFSCRPMKSG